MSNVAGICVHMNGAKCAEEYCDYWNNDKQKCSRALLTEKQIELLNMSISIYEKMGPALAGQLDQLKDLSGIDQPLTD